jgi:hypothetical protein
VARRNGRALWRPSRGSSMSEGNAQRPAKRAGQIRGHADLSSGTSASLADDAAQLMGLVHVRTCPDAADGTMHRCTSDIRSQHPPAAGTTILCSCVLMPPRIDKTNSFLIERQCDIDCHRRGPPRRRMHEPDRRPVCRLDRPGRGVDLGRMTDPRAATLALLARRAPDATICPSEVARVIAPGWRSAMPAVHAAIDGLVRDGLVRLSWKGRPLAMRSGPYRISRRIDD